MRNLKQEIPCLCRQVENQFQKSLSKVVRLKLLAVVQEKKIKSC